MVEKVDPEEIISKLEELVIYFEKLAKKINDEKEREAVHTTKH